MQTDRKPALHNLRDYIRRRARLAENDERLAPDFLRWNIEMEKRLAEMAHKNVRDAKGNVYFVHTHKHSQTVVKHLQAMAKRKWHKRIRCVLTSENVFRFV